MTFQHLTLAIAFLVSVTSVASGQTPCEVDRNGDGIVGGADLSIVLSDWGICAKCTGDVNDDGRVDGIDLAIVIARWGEECRIPAWATVLESAPDPAIVIDPSIRQTIGATGRAWRVRDIQTGMPMVLVPAGLFAMGCSTSDANGCLQREHPVHAVTIGQDFYLSQHEVSQAVWTSITGSNPSFFQAPRFSNSDMRPVETVNWSDIQGFLFATQMRLPTEAEWEYACRGGTETAFHGCALFPAGTNSSALLGTIGWYQGNSGSGATYGTHPVGTLLPNGFGVYDMLGNVWEFTSDWYAEDYYAVSPQQDPIGPPSGSMKVIRGGSYYEGPSTFHHRVSCRFPKELQDRSSAAGFRVARNP